MPEKEEEKEEINTQIKKQDTVQAIEVVSEKDDKPEVVTPPSKWPWVNKFNKKMLDSYTDTVKSETNLMDALGSHAKTKGRLRDIDVEIETDRLKRRLDLKEAQREEKIAGKKDELAELDVDLEIAKKKKELSGFGKVAEDEPEKENLKDRLEKDLEEERIKNDYERKRKIMNLFSDFKTKKQIVSIYEEERGKILNGRATEELSHEELEDLEDLDSAKEEAVNRL